MSHTPGKWEIHSNFVGPYVITANGEKVALVGGEMGAPVIANARLIAAAPELLEACKRALAGNWCTAQTCVKGGCVCNALNYAIQKAEGTDAVTVTKAEGK